MTMKSQRPGKIARRAAKIQSLAEQGGQESRIARKEMNVMTYRRGRTNVNGFFGTERLKAKVSKKSRGVKLSPQLKLAMAGKL